MVLVVEVGVVVDSQRVQMQALRMFKLLVFGEARCYGNGGRQPSKHERRTMTCMLATLLPARFNPIPYSPLVKGIHPFLSCQFA